ncbi:MAG: glycosyltransferase [Cyclobacteriaceae bacterium]
MVKNPAISVLLTFYNEEKYLSKAIQSILDQSFRNFELILVNDGSSDSSDAIVKSFQDDRIVYIEQENLGLSRALNNGLSRARGKYIARMDADDIAFPNRLQVQYDYMNAHQECVVSGSDVEIIDMNGKYVFTKYNSREFPKRMKDFYRNCPLQHPTVMFVKDIALKCGGYYEPIRQYFEDHMLWAKMRKYGELHSIPEVLLSYRLRPNSISVKGFNQGLNELKKEILIQGFATPEQLVSFEKIKQDIRTGTSERVANYHLFLARKYMLHSSDSLSIWHHASSSLKQKLRLETLALMIAAIIPFKLRRLIIDIIK